jgi:hypothetical protein
MRGNQPIAVHRLEQHPDCLPAGHALAMRDELGVADLA